MIKGHTHSVNLWQSLGKVCSTRLWNGWGWICMDLSRSWEGYGTLHHPPSMGAGNLGLTFFWSLWGCGILALTFFCAFIALKSCFSSRRAKLTPDEGVSTSRSPPGRVQSWAKRKEVTIMKGVVQKYSEKKESTNHLLSYVFFLFCQGPWKSSGCAMVLMDSSCIGRDDKLQKQI